MPAPKSVNDVIAENRTVYRLLNTGLWLLANTRIAPEDLDELQRSIVFIALPQALVLDGRQKPLKLIRAWKSTSGLSACFSGIRLE